MATITSIPYIPSVDLFDAISAPQEYAKDWVKWILDSYKDAEGVWILEDTLNHLQVIDAKNKKLLGVIRDLSDYIEPMRSQSVVSTPWGDAFNYDLVEQQSV